MCISELPIIDVIIQRDCRFNGSKIAETHSSNFKVDLDILRTLKCFLPLLSLLVWNIGTWFLQMNPCQAVHACSDRSTLVHFNFAKTTNVYPMTNFDIRDTIFYYILNYTAMTNNRQRIWLKTIFNLLLKKHVIW